jgi:hypothetical protein
MAPAAKKKSATKAGAKRSAPGKGGGKPRVVASAPTAKHPFPESVVVKRTSEIDPAHPIASGTSAPGRAIWVEAARQAREERKVVIDLVGEGRGIIAIPVTFKDEREAMEIMTPALDALVNHCAAASLGGDRPVMVDVQELRERLKLQPEEDWVAEHSWFHNALVARELLCMYVFSPGYLLEFAVAIGDKQGFGVAIAKQDPGFYQLKPRGGGEGGTILWNWARAMGDVIAGGQSWSYFGMLLALAPTIAKRQLELEGKRGASEEE